MLKTFSFGVQYDKTPLSRLLVFNKTRRIFFSIIISLVFSIIISLVTASEKRLFNFAQATYG